MRAIGLVLVSIAIMALLLTDADAKRRSSAQGSQAAGASRSWCAVHPRHGGENCGYTSFDQCWATIGSEGGWCRPNPFSATLSGPATPGQVRCARAAAGSPPVRPTAASGVELVTTCPSAHTPAAANAHASNPDNRS